MKLLTGKNGTILISLYLNTVLDLSGFYISNMQLLKTDFIMNASIQQFLLLELTF